MALPIQITRHELDADGLCRAARRAPSVAAAQRMLTLAMVLEGASRTEAATAAGMDRQTLRDWVHRYNEEGLAGRQGDPTRPGLGFPDFQASGNPPWMQLASIIVQPEPHNPADYVFSHHMSRHDRNLYLVSAAYDGSPQANGSLAVLSGGSRSHRIGPPVYDQISTSSPISTTCASGSS